MQKQYQVCPNHYVGGHVAGEILTLESSDTQTASWLNIGAITLDIDPTLEPTFEPSPSVFYHAIQASSEFQAVDSWAILNPIEPAATLLNRAMSVTLEAKAYAEKFGGNETSYAAMEVRLNQFVDALDDATDYDGATKAAIVARITQAISDGKLPIAIA